jgi:hypothetical protein
VNALTFIAGYFLVGGLVVVLRARFCREARTGHESFDRLELMREREFDRGCADFLFWPFTLACSFVAGCVRGLIRLGGGA